MNKERWIKGSCLCGSIVYQVNDVGASAGHCHCSMCRKFHGAAFATLATVQSKNFQWLEGENLLASYKASNQTVRKFCRQCGTSLIFEASQPDHSVIEFSLATLDENASIQPDAHIFTESKTNWDQAKDDLPYYRQGRDSPKL